MFIEVKIIKDSEAIKGRPARLAPSRIWFEAKEVVESNCCPNCRFTYRTISPPHFEALLSFPKNVYSKMGKEARFTCVLNEVLRVVKNHIVIDLGKEFEE